ncbi:reverse transcriptase domain-containing protein [Tanacetum coccineum]
MRTRSQSRNLHHQQQQAPPPVVEPFNLEEPIENPASPVVTMDDNRTMAQLLEAPTEGYEDAIVVPEITADNFELKHGLLNLVQNKQFFGHDKEDPHAHIRYFNKITSTMKFPNVPSTSVKLMLFPFSLEGAARIWLEKEPPRSIQTWDDLVSKFINKFFPPSKTTNLRNEITRFQQRFDETFYEAWDRFNDLLRALVEREPEVTKDTMLPTNNGSTEDVQPSVILSQTPRVPLILGRSFLKTIRALINVYEGEITLRVGREATTFNLDQTSRYTANYNHMTANQIDVIDMACEEYSQEVLGFSNVISSGNPTPYYDPIDDPTLPKVDPTYYDPDGDILLLEAILNSEPSLPLQENYFPKTRKDLKICEANNENSLVNEPPEVEFKDLPPHLEYAFL